MFDVSDRFLHQLAADRRASLERSRKASPFRTALGALLACVGSDRSAAGYVTSQQSAPGTWSHGA